MQELVADEVDRAIRAYELRGRNVVRLTVGGEVELLWRRPKHRLLRYGRHHALSDAVRHLRLALALDARADIVQGVRRGLCLNTPYRLSLGRIATEVARRLATSTLADLHAALALLRVTRAVAGAVHIVVAHLQRRQPIVRSEVRVTAKVHRDGWMRAGLPSAAASVQYSPDRVSATRRSKTELSGVPTTDRQRLPIVDALVEREAMLALARTPGARAGSERHVAAVLLALVLVVLHTRVDALGVGFHPLLVCPTLVLGCSEFESGVGPQRASIIAGDVAR